MNRRWHYLVLLVGWPIALAVGERTRDGIANPTAKAMGQPVLVGAVSDRDPRSGSEIPPTRGSVTSGDEGDNPLAVKQQIVRDRMVQLEDRVFRLIEQLSTREPEQAAKLTTALKKARELLIRRNMDTTIRLLNDEDLAGASDKQIEIIRDLENVLKVLLEDPDSERQRQEEIARLEAFREQVRQLLEAQRKLEALAKAAEPQKQLAEKTGQLGKEMSGQKTETQPARPPAPGSENVERSEQHMKNASQALGQQKTDQGRESQKQAENELQQAIENLDQAIEQLKQEQREQTQRKLQTLLQAMLDKQLTINQETLALDKKGRAAWTHADDLTLTGLGRDQMALADQTSEVLRLLKSDGTTLVFPQVMGQVRDDMERVAGRLQKKNTGGDTQRIQTAIAETLAQLIEALKESAANPPPQTEGDSGSGGGQGCNPPLVPPSAELKLLRSCQQRLNQRTIAANASIEKNPAASSDQQDDLRKLTQQQNNLADLARQIHEKWTEKK